MDASALLRSALTSPRPHDEVLMVLFALKLDGADQRATYDLLGRLHAEAEAAGATETAQVYASAMHTVAGLVAEDQRIWDEVLAFGPSDALTV